MGEINRSKFMSHVYVSEELPVNHQSSAIRLSVLLSRVFLGRIGIALLRAGLVKEVIKMKPAQKTSVK
jgi:hypothetical protein